MKRLLVFVLLVSLGLNVALALRLRQAAPGGDRTWRDRNEQARPAAGDTLAWRDRMDRRFERMSRALGLDAHQQAAFHRHRERVEADVRDRSAALESSRALLRAEAARQPPVPAAVAAALAAVGRAEAVLDSLVAANLQEELELLRPDQQARLLRMLHFERLGARGGPGAGRGDGHGPRHGRGGSSGRGDGGSGE